MDIEIFKNVRNSLSEKGLYESLLDIILIKDKNNGIRSRLFNIVERIYPKGTIFCRVRRKDSLQDLTYSDFWAPPESVIQNGRLNTTGERMLYMSIGEINTPLKEIKIKNDEKFLAIYYQSEKDIILTEIGFSDPNNIDHDEVRNILDSIFIENFDGIYKITNLIVKKINNLENFGWCYSSVANKDRINVCLKKEYQSLLNIINISQCSISKDDDFKVHSIIKVNEKEEIEVQKDKDLISKEIEILKKKFNEVEKIPPSKILIVPKIGIRKIDKTDSVIV